jgi:hypothetical protein
VLCTAATAAGVGKTSATWLQQSQAQMLSTACHQANEQDAIYTTSSSCRQKQSNVCAQQQQQQQQLPAEQ